MGAFDDRRSWWVRSGCARFEKLKGRGRNGVNKFLVGKWRVDGLSIK